MLSLSICNTFGQLHMHCQEGRQQLAAWSRKTGAGPRAAGASGGGGGVGVGGGGVYNNFLYRDISEYVR